MDIKEFRQKYPQYNDIPDWELARRLHARYYRDMDFKEFARRFGLVEEPSFEAKHPNIYAAGKAAVETVKRAGQALKQVPSETVETVKDTWQFLRQMEGALQGAEEAAASFLTGTYTLPISGLAMLYHLGKKFFQKGKIEDKDLDEAIKKGEQIGSIFQYKPKTKYGKIYSRYLGEVMSWPSEVIRELGSKLVEKGVHPAIVTAITTPLEFGAYGLLFKGAEGLVPRARTLREVQWPKEEPTVGVREEIKAPEVKPEARAKVEIKPEKEEIAKPVVEEPKPEPKPEAEPKPEPEPKPEAKPEVKPEEKPLWALEKEDFDKVLQELKEKPSNLSFQNPPEDLEILAIELTGSRARGEAKPTSDTDYFVYVNKNLTPHQESYLQNTLTDRLSRGEVKLYTFDRSNLVDVKIVQPKHKRWQEKFGKIEPEKPEELEEPKEPVEPVKPEPVEPTKTLTEEQKEILRGRGFTENQINKLLPEEAQRLIVEGLYPEQVSVLPTGKVKVIEKTKTSEKVKQPWEMTPEEFFKFKYPKEAQKLDEYRKRLADAKKELEKIKKTTLPSDSKRKKAVSKVYRIEKQVEKLEEIKNKALKEHEEIITDAMIEKKDIPLEVLKEYGKEEYKKIRDFREKVISDIKALVGDKGYIEINDENFKKLVEEYGFESVVKALHEFKKIEGWEQGPNKYSGFEVFYDPKKHRLSDIVEKTHEEALRKIAQQKKEVWQMTPEEYAEKSGLPFDKAYEEWKQKVIESEFEIMPHLASKEALEVLDEWFRQSAEQFEPYQQEMFEQAKEPLWRQFEVVNKILQEEGINSKELSSFVGVTGIQEIRSKFGVKVVKKNGLPLDEFGKRVREEAPDLLPEDYDLNDVINLLESTPSRKQIKEMTGVIRYYREKGQEVLEEPEVPKGGIEFKPIPEGRRRSAIIEHISKKLEIPIRIGKFRTLGGKRVGIYKPREKVIRLAKANDLETVFHEIGHYIQDLLGFPKEMPNEVRRLAYEGAKDIDAEGFAEFVRYYITNPTKARNKAPNFYAVFEQRVKTFPDVQDVLDKAREAWNLWKQAPAVAKIDSLIVRGGKKKPLVTREALNKIYTQVKDDLYPLQLLKKEAEKRLGRELLPSEDPYLLARLTRGWARKAEQYLKYGTFQYDPVEGVKFTGKSLREILEPVAKKGELSLLEDYLIAKRALYDERILKGFEGILTKEDFRKVVDELEPKFKNVAEEIYKYSDELLKYLVDSGRISEQLAKTIKKKNLFYVPFYRVMDYEPTSGRLSSRKFSNLFNPIKRLKGSSRDIYSPLESLIYNTYVMINAAERNRVGEALIKLSQVPGMGKFIERVPFRMKPIKITKGEALKGLLSDLSKEEKEYFLKQLGDLPKEVLQEMFVTFRPNIKPGPNEVIFYDKGKPVLFEVASDLAEALTNIDAANLSVLVKILSYPAKWLRAGATTFSLEFALRNPARDQLTAFLQTRYGFIPGIDFLRGLFHILKKDELWQRFNASGAAHSALVSLDRDYLSQNLKKLIKGSKIKGLVKNPLELLQALSEFTEEATRVGEFARAIKKEGKDYEALLKAGMAGREITMDFARQGGRAARFWNAISAFWNARIEGVDKMIRTFKEQPLKTSAKAFLGITLPSLLLWYINKDDPYYQELPEWRKVLFWNIVLHNDDGTLKTIISLPKPFEYGLIFGSIPEAALDWLYRNDPVGMKKTAIQIAEALKFDPIPTAAIPLIEWWANKSMFFDRPIVPRGKEALEPVLQYGPYTSETVKLIAELMDKVPGLKEIASPAKIENLIHGYFAAMGDLALKAGDWLIEKFGVADVPPEPKMTLADLPGVRAFIARFPSANTKSIEEFYEKYNRLNQKWESYRQRIGVRGWGTRIKLPAEFAKLEVYRKAAKTLSLLRKMADCIYESPTLTPEKKREMLDNIYLSMINVARAALGKGRLK